MIEAIVGGDLGQVKQRVSEGADVHYKRGKVGTLAYAIQYGELEIVSYLIEEHQNFKLKKRYHLSLFSISRSRLLRTCSARNILI